MTLVEKTEYLPHTNPKCKRLSAVVAAVKHLPILQFSCIMCLSTNVLMSTIFIDDN